MTTLPSQKLMGTSASVTTLGFGAAGLGDLHERMTERDGLATLEAAWDNGLRYFDTSPWYGVGKSELRLGALLRNQPREEFTISSKVGRKLARPADLSNYSGHRWVGGLPFEVKFDYTYDGIMRSYEDSLQRLGLNRIDLLLIHDLEANHHEAAVLAKHMHALETSGVRALEQLKRTGEIKGFGAGINLRESINFMLDHVDPDFLLVAMPYTLLDQDVLDYEFPRLMKQEIGVVIGSVFAGNILATGPVKNAHYQTRPASEQIIEKTRKIEAICQAHSVDLKSAALQFPLAHPLVAAIVPGANSPQHVVENRQLLEARIPVAFWDDLKRESLLHHDAPVPGGLSH